MTQADNRKIGDAAAGVIKDAFRSVKEAQPFIKTDDSGICIDGYIELYSSESELSKKTLIGQLPIQVKGTVTQPKPSDRPKRSVDVTDLKRYLDVFHGVLYFVVFFDRNLEVRGIYYDQLLPYDINQILSKNSIDFNSSDKKKLTHRFKPLPKSQVELRRLLHEFQRNRELQIAMKDVGVCNVDAWNERGVEFQSFAITKTQFVGEPEVPSLESFSNGMYVYGLTEDNRMLPVERLDDVLSFERIDEHVVEAGDVKYRTKVKIGEDVKGRYLSFGSFMVRWSAEPKWLYESRGDFRDRLRDARLMRSLVNGADLLLDGTRICGGVKMGEDAISALDLQLESFPGFAALLEKMRVKTSIDPNLLTRGEVYNLGRLKAAFIDGENVPVSANGASPVNLNLEIGDRRLKVFAFLQPDGKYELADPLDPACKYAISLLVGEGPDGHVLVPQMLLLSREDFERVANLDVERFVESLEKYPIVESTADAANNKLLDMLLAYDHGAACPDDLLECCRLLSEALQSVDVRSLTYFINAQQVRKRLGESLDEDRLFEIERSSNSEREQICAAILLEDDSFVARAMKRLSEDDRSALESWPVLNLWKQPEAK